MVAITPLQYPHPDTIRNNHMAEFTFKQGRYLSYIHAYTQLHGRAPSEAEMVQNMRVTAPSVHNMVKTLESKGFIERQPGVARSIKILVPAEEIPAWSREPAAPVTPTPTRAAKSTAKLSKVMARAIAPTGKLYRLAVYLCNSVGTRASCDESILRVIEIRGDQTLADLHFAIFDSFDREDEHLYEFILGKTPRDRKGPTFGVMVDPYDDDEEASETLIGDLGLRLRRAFWYMFDFGHSWWHRIEVQAISTPAPKTKYPRIAERKGKSPPQYPDWDEDE